MERKRPKRSAGRRAAPSAESGASLERKLSWTPKSSSVLWLKLNFTIKTARLQSLKRQKYQHLQEEALLKARGLLKNWEDGVVLTEDLYNTAHNESDARELVNYTPEALALRFSLRNNPAVIDAVKQLWAVELPRDQLGCIDEHGYAALFRRIGRSLEPEASARRRRRMEKTIREDWLRDSKGEPTMSFANFFDSVFELADLWCETIDVDEYVVFLRSLVTRIATVRSREPGRRLLRPLKQIKGIDNDEAASSSSEEIAESDLNEEEQEIAGEADANDDDDGDDEEEEEELPRQRSFHATPALSIGLVASKALNVFRAKTPPPSAGLSTNAKDPEERPVSRERRASIITLGDFMIGGLGGVVGNLNNGSEESPKSPKALRGSSAKSRVASAKGKSPLTTLQESSDGIATAEDDGGVNALVAMHRLQSANVQAPVAVEDARRVPLNVKKTATKALPMQQQQRPAKVFAASFGTQSQPGIGTTTVNMDGLSPPATQGPRGGLMSSGPRQTKQTGLKSGMFGDFDNARVESGGARRAKLSSNAPKTQTNLDRTTAGFVLDGANQSGGSGKVLSALGVASSGSLNHEGQDVATMQSVSTAILGNADQAFQSRLGDDQAAIAGPRDYISGMGLEVPPDLQGTGPTRSQKTEASPVNFSLPFYTLDDSVSPAKRLLPPVLTENGGRGRSAGSKNSRRQSGSDHENELDFAASFKKTTYLSGSLTSQIHSLAYTQLSLTGARGDGRPMSSGSPWPGKDSKFNTRRTLNNLPIKRRTLSPDDGYNDGTVSPWDTDHEQDDVDLARAVPHNDKRWDDHQRTPPRRITASTPALLANQFKPPQESLVSKPPALVIPATLAPPEQPSCCSDVMTMPQEYHELLLGGSSLNRQSNLTRTESAPVPTTYSLPAKRPVVYPAKLLDRAPQWITTQDVAQSSLTLLVDGVKGRTVNSGGSPRQVLALQAPKRPRHDRECCDGDGCGLCPRFVGHLESHGDHPSTAPSPHFRTDKSRCSCNGNEDEMCQCHPQHSNNNLQVEDAEENPKADAEIDEVTMIVNATRGLILRPGTMDRYAAKRAKYKQQATRSEMMRRRFQFTFGKG